MLRSLSNKNKQKNMQDIIPPSRQSRGHIRPGDRSRPQSPVSRDYNTVYIERRMVNLSSGPAQPTMTETITVITEVQAPQMPTETDQIILSNQPIPTRGDLSTDQKVRAMTRALEIARKDLEKEHHKRTFLKRLTLALTAVVLLLSTGYVGLNTWMTNNQVKAQAASQTAAIQGSGSTHTTAAVEGSDTTPLPPGTLTKYQVAPNLPRAIYISKLHVAARTLPMGVNTDGSMQAPINIYDAGWYTGSVKPGDIGAVVIDGHSSADHGALFGHLDKLVVGDQIQLEKGDGTRLTYQVVHTDTVDKDSVDMKSLLLPYGNALRALNLITCAGDWINSEDTLSKRVIVYTEQI